MNNELERRAGEADEQMRQLEETKTLERLKIDIDINEEVELHPEISERPVAPDSWDFLENFSGSDDEDYFSQKGKST